MRTVSVSLPGREYPIHIGAGARAALARVVADATESTRLAIVADEQVARLHLPKLLEALPITPAAVIEFPAGEASKCVPQLGRIHDALANARIGRRDLVLTFGGGVAGDLGGFAAATWLRGVRFVQVPTTLLAAVDASSGGKTGINHATGKNLIGAFHQPLAVVVDTEFLATLDNRDYAAGLAESVKHATIRDAELLTWHEQQAEAIRDRDPAVVEDLIARSCSIKADVVVVDERESGLRMILNHGHTIGHAFEHLLEYELLHGECVGLGMLAENEIACGRGLLDRADAARIANLLATFGLPTRLPRQLEAAAVADACQTDKKARAGSVNYVLLKGIGDTQRVNDVNDAEITQAVAAVWPD